MPVLKSQPGLPGARRLLTILLLGTLLVPSSCIKEEDYPDIPAIGYQGITLVFPNDTVPFATRGILSISFQDGNGDIGLQPRDTLPPYNKEGEYYYNYVIRYFEKRDTGYTEVILNPPYSARIPMLNMGYEGKPIKGIIVDTLELDPAPDYDTVRFELFIYDRALNKSNVLTTPDIVLRRKVL